MKKLFIVLICLLFSALQASAYSFKELAAEPNSLAKDFFLNNLLEANALKASELEQLKKHIYRYAGKIVKNHAAACKKAGIKLEEKSPAPSENSCWNFSPKSVQNASNKCQKLLMANVKFVKNIPAKNLVQIAAKWDKIDAKFAQQLRIFAAKNPTAAAIKHGRGELVLGLFYAGIKLVDAPLGPMGQKSFLSSQHAQKFLFSALSDNKFIKLRRSLLGVKNPWANISEDLAFTLGLNALVFDHRTTAKKFFLAASKAAKFKRPRDNALWFAYLVSRDAKILKQVAASDDLNIYSLYAREILGLKGYDISIPQPNKTLKDEPISDALHQARWLIELKNADEKQLRSMLERFYATNTMGQYLAVFTRLNGFSENIYPMPFAEYLKDANTEEKALLYAIAMQESRFLPASVSTSYALGMMQFMPFVARHTAKTDFGINDFDVTKMFEPSTALPFALAHIRTLRKGVSSALFVAYAYNGGLGFTKRMLAKPFMFSNLKHQYEPFLSMELVPYAESRLYGKKVLANYYVYKNLLGEKITMKELFSALDKAKDLELVEQNKMLLNKESR